MKNLKLITLMFVSSMILMGCFLDSEDSDKTQPTKINSNLLSTSPKTITVRTSQEATISSGKSGDVTFINKETDCSDSGKFIVELDTLGFKYEIEGDKLVFNLDDACFISYEGSGNPYGEWVFQESEGNEICLNSFSKQLDLDYTTKIILSEDYFTSEITVEDYCAATHIMKRYQSSFLLTEMLDCSSFKGYLSDGSYVLFQIEKFNVDGEKTMTASYDEQECLLSENKFDEEITEEKCTTAYNSHMEMLKMEEEDDLNWEFFYFAYEELPPKQKFLSCIQEMVVDPIEYDSDEMGNF